MYLHRFAGPEAHLLRPQPESLFLAEPAALEMYFCDMRFPFPVLAVTVVALCWGAKSIEAQGADTSEAVAPVKPNAKTIDAKNKDHLLKAIDIFGQSEMPAIYILAPGQSDVEGMLLVRDFSRDPFFMQNIDREEFEMNVALHDMSESFLIKKDEDKKNKKDEDDQQNNAEKK